MGYAQVLFFIWVVCLFFFNEFRKLFLRYKAVENRGNRSGVPWKLVICESWEIFEKKKTTIVETAFSKKALTLSRMLPRSFFQSSWFIEPFLKFLLNKKIKYVLFQRVSKLLKISYCLLKNENLKSLKIS